MVGEKKKKKTEPYFLSVLNQMAGSNVNYRDKQL